MAIWPQIPADPLQGIDEGDVMNYVISVLSFLISIGFGIDASTQSRSLTVFIQCSACVFMFLVAALFAQGFDFNAWMMK